MRNPSPRPKPILFLSAALFSAAAMACLIRPVSAHGLVTTQSMDLGNYTIEFEYDTLGTVYSQTTYNFYFRLLDKNSKAGKTFTEAYVEFDKPAGGIAASATLSPIDVGVASFGTALAQPGKYPVKISFYSGGNTLAQPAFTLDVQKNPNRSGFFGSIYFWILVAIAAVLLGLALGMLLCTRLPRLFKKKL